MTFLPQQNKRRLNTLGTWKKLSINFINEKFEEMEVYRKDKERQICKLKNEVKTLNEIEEIMNESGSS